MEIASVLILVLTAYLLGSIPSGYLAGKAKGIDLRSMGSGNIGATNAFRILGKTAGTIVLVSDGLKGWLAVALLPGLILHLMMPGSNGMAPEYWRILAGIGAILGHNYTCWLKFKGGKGIATSAGALAALVPWPFVIVLVTFVAICFLTRYVSAGSIAAAVVLPFATLAFYSWRMALVTSLLSALAIYKHKANIKRLMNGTENKIGRKPTPPPAGATS